MNISHFEISLKSSSFHMS